jgi:hypothetical protein
MLVEGRQAPLVTLISNIGILILLKTLTLLIDRVVCEMCKLVRFDILWVVFVTGKTDKTLVKNVNSPRVHARDENI